MAVNLQMPELRLVSADNKTVLDLDPIRGLWTAEQYLRLADSNHQLLEFTAASNWLEAL